LRKQFLPFHVPNVSDEEVRAVARVMKSGWMTTGPQVRRFEEEFARYIGVRRAVALNSATAALHLALLALGVEEGDEVLVPTMTFAATAEVVFYLRAKPVLVDCLPGTLNIDPRKLEKAITRRTKAVIVVHFAGHPCDMDEIMAVARRRGLKVIEDAAHAPPARYKGRMVGTFGDAACFSFHAIKTVTTGEGGMLVARSRALADRVRILSLHGISKDAWKRYAAGGSWRYDIRLAGYKYNMTDIAAAMGLCQLAKCDASWEARQRHARRYSERLRDVPEVRTPAALPHVQHAWHLYVLQLRVERLSISRDRFIELLNKANIGVSVHFIPLHRHSFYRRTFGFGPGSFPTADDAFKRTISLPLYPRMSRSDVDYVAGTVRAIAARHRR
jgi:perosamine synthetase